MTLIGYFLGKAVPNIDDHLHMVVAVVIFLSLLPAIIAWLRERMKAKKAAAPAAYCRFSGVVRQLKPVAGFPSGLVAGTWSAVCR